MKLRNIKEFKHSSMDGTTILLIISVLFVLINVILTVNGLSPFEILK